MTLPQSQPPVTRLSGHYEMRLESIGGLGAHLAGGILAEAGVLGMGLTGAHFSSYGSEKKGSPVKSFIRLGPSDRQLRTTSPVRKPDLAAVFHDALLTEPGVTTGLEPGSTLVVNSASSPEEIARRVRLPGVLVLTVDAVTIALQEQTRVNTAMMGAIVRGAPVLEPEPVRQVIAATFGKKYPQLVEANLRTFDRGHTETGSCRLSAEELGVDLQAEARPAAHTGPTVGYRTAPIGGILSTPGSTVHKNLAASRQGYLPVLNTGLCVNCAICDLVCPDFCFVWVPTGDQISGYSALKLAGIDFRYCKGCMHCVQECPTGALTKVREVGDMAGRLGVPLSLSDQASAGVPRGAAALTKSGWGVWGEGEGT